MARDEVGRYARGAQRRGVLIEAAADLLLEQGLAALSHRAVASRAGLPLASTTYYFTSADDLRDQALQHVAEAWAARARAVVADLPGEVDAVRAAEAVVGIIGADTPTPQVLLLYERYLEAGRHPRLRSVVETWNSRLRELVADVLRRAGLPADEDTARLVLALADGVAVTALAEGAAPDQAVAVTLRQLFSLLRGSLVGGPGHPG